MNGLTLEQLARSTLVAPEMLLDVLREEIAAGRVQTVENGRIFYQLTPTGRRELERIFDGIDGFAAIRGPK